MPAETHPLIAGGNVPLDDSDGPRSWRTNWPVHLGVVATATIGVVISPGAPAAGLALAWIAVYALGHRVYVMARVPAAGPATVVVSTAVALALMGVSGQGVHLFAAFPLIWLFLPTFRQGLVATLAAAAAMVAVLVAESEEPSGGEVLGLVAFGVAIALFSALMSAWIWRVERLAHERQEIADQMQETVTELRATRADLAASERSRGAQEEGTRIAAEIHDTLAQSFTSITMLTQAARQGGTDPRPLLDRIEDVSRSGLAEARGLIAGSQTPLDLAASVERLAHDLQARTGLAITVDVTGWGPAPTRTEVVLLRTAQEALRNIERHADATNVTVRLAREQDDSVLEIGDDGAGFEADLPTAGFGLLGMRARLESEGGGLAFASRRGAGTTLRATLPRGTAVGPEGDHAG